MAASTSRQARRRQGLARVGHPLLADPMLRWVAVVGGCLLVGFALDLGSDVVQVGVGWTVSTSLLTLASFLSARVARLLRGTPPLRFWVSMSVACGLFAVANLAQLVAALRHPSSSAAVESTGATAAFGGMAAVVLVVVMLSYPSGAHSRAARIRFWLDLAVVATAAATYGAYFGASSLPADRSRMLGWALTIAAGPVMLCLAGLGVAKLLLSGEPPFTRVAGLFGAAAAATSAVSSGLAPALVAPNRQHWFFVLGGLANLFVVASARAQYLGVEAGPQRLSRRRRPYSVLPYVTVLAAYGLLVAGLRVHGLSPAGWAVVIGATACTCLVILRQLAAFTENARLLAERDRLTAELEYRAYHDGLTGLANRTLFFDRAESALALARRTGGTTAVALLDLDGFKPVNDLRGHHVGDAVLVAIADRLRACLRAGDTVARLGGDEFAILLADVDPQVLHGLAERLRDGVSELVEVDGGPVQVGCSIGFALEPGDGDRDVTALVRAADEAMYAAKARGRAAVVFQTGEAPAVDRA
jgi:diguanylate cyclase (GGDEF)-like protein